MARLAAQTAAVVGMNLRSLPSRASLALVTLLAVAIVVAVLLGFLAMAGGFGHLLIRRERGPPNA